MQSSDQSKKYYDQNYFLNSVDGWAEFKEFCGDWQQLYPRYRKNLELLNLQSSDRLLEFGCGRGEIIMYHTKNGGYAVGNDYSGDAIQLAEQKAKDLKLNCRFFCCPFDQINLDTKFNKILASEFIEHISEEEGIKFFRLAKQFLEPGGKLLVYTHPNTLQRRFGYPLQRFYVQAFKGINLPKQQLDTLDDHYKYYHLNEQNIFSLQKMAKGAGFKNVTVTYTDEETHEITGPRRYLARNRLLKHIVLTGLTLTAIA